MAADNEVNVKLKVDSSEAKDDVKKVSGDISTLKGSLGDVNNQLGVVNTGLFNMFKTLGSGIKSAIAGMGGFKAAIAATGIGLLIIAVGTLVAWFTKTEDGAKSLRVITAALGAVFEKIVNTLINVGKNVIKMVSSFDNFKQSMKDLGQAIVDNVLNRLKAFGVMAGAVVKIIKGEFAQGFKELGNSIIQGTFGITDGIDKLTEFTKTIVKTVDEGANLQKRIDALADAQDDFALTIEKTNAKILRQQEISKDKSKTDAERVAALKEESRLQESLATQQLLFAKEALSIAEEKNRMSTKSEQDNDDLLAAQVNLQKAENDLAKTRFANIGKLSSLQNAITADTNAATEAAKKKEEEEKAANAEKLKTKLDSERAFQDELNDLKDKNYLDSIDDDITRRKAEIDLEQERAEEDLDRRYNDKLLTDEQYFALQDEFDALYLKKRKEVALTEQEIELEKKAIKAKLAEDEKKIAKDKAKVEQDMAFTTASAIIDGIQAVFGESKEAASAAVLIDTFQGAISAFNGMQKAIPGPVGFALGLIAAAGVTSKGYKAINDINSTQKKESSAKLPAKKALGGWIGGVSHENGGVNINAEAGEFMVNKRSMSNPSIAASVIAANNAGNNGGFSTSNFVSKDEMVAYTVDVVKSIPVNVVEQDVTNIQRKVQVQEQRFVSP